MKVTVTSGPKLGRVGLSSPCVSFILLQQLTTCQMAKLSSVKSFSDCIEQSLLPTYIGVWWDREVEFVSYQWDSEVNLSSQQKVAYYD